MEPLRLVLNRCICCIVFLYLCIHLDVEAVCHRDGFLTTEDKMELVSVVVTARVQNWTDCGDLMVRVTKTLKGNPRKLNKQDIRITGLEAVGPVRMGSTEPVITKCMQNAIPKKKYILFLQETYQDDVYTMQFNGVVKSKQEERVLGKDIERENVDGDWSLWGEWTSCSVTCDYGNRIRQRSCHNPTPHNGGQDCQGDDAEFMPCSGPSCRIDGDWSLWSEWTSCSVTCEDGNIIRQRSCDNPTHQNGGRYCQGYGAEFMPCSGPICPKCWPGTCSKFDGDWSLWGEWTSCSVTCEDGNRTRQRSCDNPTPQNGGQDCQGDDAEFMPCSGPFSPIHGGFSEWESWGSCEGRIKDINQCSIHGIKIRFRTCTNPRPQHGGDVCTGLGAFYMRRSCRPEYCPASCEKNCTRIYDPDCGTDGTTYNNQCLLEVAFCKDLSLRWASGGPCPTIIPASCEKSCTNLYGPHCGTDGTTYINHCLLDIAMCKDPSLRWASGGPCPTIIVPQPAASATFDGRSYISYNLQRDRIESTEDTLVIWFQTTRPNGLILHFGSQHCYYYVGIVNGMLEVAINLGSGEYRTTGFQDIFMDNLWHIVRIYRLRRVVYIRVDQELDLVGHTQGGFETLTADRELFVGGASDPRGLPGSSSGDNFVGKLGNVFYYQHDNGDIKTMDLLGKARNQDSNVSIVGDIGFEVEAIDPLIPTSCETIICSMIYDPKCGTDGTTYNNQCLQKKAMCKNPSLQLDSSGPCPTSCETINCSWIHDPKCATDGTTYNTQCLLKTAMCKNPSLQLASSGPCPTPTPGGSQNTSPGGTARGTIVRSMTVGMSTATIRPGVKDPLTVTATAMFDPSSSVVSGPPVIHGPSCPQCSSNVPVDFNLCDATRAHKGTVAEGQIRLLSSVLNGQDVAVTGALDYYISDQCSCPQLANGERVFVIVRGTDSIDQSAQRINLDGDITILTRSGTVKRQLIKLASKC